MLTLLRLLEQTEMMHVKFLSDCLAHSEYSLNVVYCHLPDTGPGAGDAVIKHWCTKIIPLEQRSASYSPWAKSVSCQFFK